MKTNVTMLSDSDRNLFGVTIRQQTNGEMLSLTDLEEAYTYARVQFGWKDKEYQKILNFDGNIERIYYILNEQKLILDKKQLNAFYEIVKEKGMTKVLKEYGVYKTTGRGENKMVVCNPYIWMLVAMEMNPMLYAKVVTWVTDKLILNRIEAGDFYNELASALYKLPDTNYPELGKSLNMKIFGKHEPGLRNKGSEKELENLKKLEYGLAFGINQGWIKNMEQVQKTIDEFEVRI